MADICEGKMEQNPSISKTPEKEDAEIGDTDE